MAIALHILLWVTNDLSMDLQLRMGCGFCQLTRAIAQIFFNSADCFRASSIKGSDFSVRRQVLADVVISADQGRPKKSSLTVPKKHRGKNGYVSVAK